MAQPPVQMLENNHKVSIAPLLKKLATPASKRPQISAEEIALAWSRIFEDRITSTQLSSLLTLLCVTELDKRPDIIARCAEAMRHAATPIDEKKLRAVLRTKRQKQQQNHTSNSRRRGTYRGGVCDIVGTGGDHHGTFNISTTSSIIASPLIAMAKHGNRASSSLSGSADVLSAVTPIPPKILSLTPEILPSAYEECNYVFLMAPNFHPSMKYAAGVRRELGLRTIFNLMGPLANPVESSIEARVIGVAYHELGGIFADALQLYGTKKAMVVCGQEDLDEISCAGHTNCWWIKEVPNPKYKASAPSSSSSKEQHTNPSQKDDHEASSLDTSDDDDDEDEQGEPPFLSHLETFQLHPSDFGLPTHPLSAVGGGKLPQENARVLMSILRNELPRDHPIMDFVLCNVAALLVVSGVCDRGGDGGDDDDDSRDADVITEVGPGGGRWKEGVRLARRCVESGEALREFERFIEFTNRIS